MKESLSQRQKWADLRTNTSSLVGKVEGYFSKRSELIDYLIEDPGGEAVRESLQKMKEDVGNLRAMAPLLTNFCSSTIDPLVQKGSLEDIFAKDPEYKRFADKLQDLQSLEAMQDENFEESLTTCISNVGSHPLAHLGEENLCFLFDMKLRKAMVNCPAPQETHQLALHTQAQVESILSFFGGL